jgi:hypothetical protein
MTEATDSTLRITADRARGDADRKGLPFFNIEAYTASLRAVYELGFKHGKESKEKE